MSGQSTTKSEVAKRLCGVWRYVGARIDGKPRSGLGANPKGIIYYDSSGAMVVQVAPDRERGKAGSAPTPEEAHAALADYVAYFGSYSVDERAGTVTHHRHGSVQPVRRRRRPRARIRVRGRSVDLATARHDL